VTTGVNAPGCAWWLGTLLCVPASQSALRQLSRGTPFHVTSDSIARV